MSERMGWQELWDTFKRKKFCGKFEGGRATMTVVDVSLGGDVVVRRPAPYKCDMVITQEKFLAYVKTARLIE